MSPEDPKQHGNYLMNSGQLAAQAAREERELDAACPWKFDAKAISLVFEPGESGDGYDYDIDLEKCTSSAEVLDWIAQVAQKSWVDDAALGSLVRKLDRLLDLQATLCGGGEDHQLDPVDHLRKSGRIK